MLAQDIFGGTTGVADRAPQRAPQITPVDYGYFNLFGTNYRCDGGMSYLPDIMGVEGVVLGIAIPGVGGVVWASVYGLASVALDLAMKQQCGPPAV